MIPQPENCDREVGLVGLPLPLPEPLRNLAEQPTDFS